MSDDFQSPPPAAPQAPVTPGPDESPSSNGKLLATLSYLYFIWPVPGIIALLIEPFKNERFVRVHAIQSLALGLAMWVLSGVLWIIGLGWLVWMAGVVYGIILALKANKGEYFEVPVIYDMVKSYI